MKKKIKLGLMHRSALIERAHIDEEARTVELSFSSEEPVSRYFGREVLDHKSSSVRLGRLRAGGAVLMGHDTRDHVGVVEQVRIVDKRGLATVRFGKSVRANEVFQDVVDGIRKFVSVGYRIHDKKPEVTQGRGDDEPTVRFQDWEPLEISIASVPEDASVGVGRAADGEDTTTVEISEERDMNCKVCGLVECKCAAAPVVTDPQRAATPAAPVAQVVNVPTTDPKREAEVRKAETNRITTILALGARHGKTDLADAAVRDDTPLGEFRENLLNEMSQGQAPMKPVASDGRALGLSKKDVREFSFFRLLNYQCDKGDAYAREAAAFEIEACREWAKKTGRDSIGVLIPPDLMCGGAPFNGQRATITDGTEGADLTATNHLAGSFVDLLRDATPVTGLATMLTGLTGDVLIPTQTGGATAAFDAETDALTQTEATFGQIALNPKRVGTWSEMSRRAMIQFTPDLESLIRNDLLMALAQKIEDVAIEGGGTDEPDGVTQTAGIGSADIGTNGGAMTWAKLVELESDVDVGNALMGRLGYVTTPEVVGQLKRVEKASSTGQFLWDSRATDGPVNGYQCLRTNKVPKNLTKGTLSATAHAMIFGNWADLLIGVWDTMELIVNPYTKDTQGLVRIVIQHEIDVKVRRVASFSATLDIDETA